MRTLQTLNQNGTVQMAYDNMVAQQVRKPKSSNCSIKVLAYWEPNSKLKKNQNSVQQYEKTNRFPNQVVLLLHIISLVHLQVLEQILSSIVLNL